MSSEIAIIENTKVVPLKAGGRVNAIIPQSVEEVFRIATAIAKSGLAPNGMRTAEQITVAIMHGAEVGLPPMQAIQRIAVVNGRPTIWGDAIPALLLSRGFRLEETIDGTDDGRGATCTVTRPDGNKITRRFSIADAKAAGLWGKQGPWKQYPERMLQMRARGFASRDGAAVVLAGLYLNEEIADIDMTPARKSAYEAKKDGSVEQYETLRRTLHAAQTEQDVDAIFSNNEEFLKTIPAGWLGIMRNEADEKRREMSAPQSQDAVLREIERALQHMTVEGVHAQFSTAIMAMDEDGRAAALEMIEASKAAE